MSGYFGMKVTMSKSVKVKSLGRMLMNPSTQTHTLAIYDANSGAKIAGSDATVAGGTINAFTYGDIAGDVTLLAGKSYIIASSETEAGDWWSHRDCSLSGSVGTIASASYSFDGQVWGFEGSQGQSFGILDFTYEEINIGGGFVSNVDAFGTPTAHFAGFVGYSFTVGNDDLNITELGRFFIPGSTETHTLKIINSETGFPIDGGVVTVSPVSNDYGFVYAKLADPVRLNANTTYYLVSEEFSNIDHWYFSDSTFTTTGAAVVNHPVFGADGGYNPDAGEGRSLGLVDFKYEIAEKDSLNGFATVTAPGSTRNELTAWVGYSMTVGEKDLLVKSLGRYFLSGNTQAHTVAILEPGVGVVAIKEVPAGGVVGAFTYVELDAPVLLKAGKTYYVVGLENAGGDYWLHNNGVVTPAEGVGTINCSVYSFDGAAYGTEGGNNISLSAYDFRWEYITENDINGDNEFNVLDLILIRNVVLGKDVASTENTLRAESSNINGFSLISLLELKSKLFNS